MNGVQENERRVFYIYLYAIMPITNGYANGWYSGTLAAANTQRRSTIYGCHKKKSSR